MTTDAQVVSRRAAAGTDLLGELKLLGRQIGYEQRSYWRNPVSAFFTFAFPMVLFIIFNSLLKGDKGPGPTYYTPSILSYAVMSSCFLGVTMQFVNRREFGIFKRLRGTPLPAWTLIGGTVGSVVVVAALQTAVALLLGELAYGVRIPAMHLIPIVATVLLAAVAFCAIGIAASSFIPNADAGPAVVNLPYFVLVFISGTYFPVGGGMARFAGYLPLRPFLLALKHAVQSPAAVSGWSGTDLLHLAVWGVIGAFVAVRRFQWSPRRS